jgi:hypothetical protein
MNWPRRTWPAGIAESCAASSAGVSVSGVGHDRGELLGDQQRDDVALNFDQATEFVVAVIDDRLADLLIQLPCLTFFPLPAMRPPLKCGTHQHFISSWGNTVPEAPPARVCA